MKTAYLGSFLMVSSVAFAAPSQTLTALRDEARVQSKSVAAVAQSLEELRNRVLIHPPPLDRQFHIARQMQALGKDGFFPLVALFSDSAVTSAPERERRMLKLGALEALRRLRDERGAVLYRDLFDNDPDLEVARGAAEALGALETDEAMQFLLARATAGHPRERAAVSGLAFCRRGEVAGRMAARMTELPDEKTMRVLAKSAGFWGSSWAWHALGATREADGLGARQTLASTLLAVLPSYQNDTRLAIVNALATIEHPSTTYEIERVRTSAPADVRKELDALATRLTK